MMSDEPEPPFDDDNNPDDDFSYEELPEDDATPRSEEVQQTHISAIVPDRVKPGLFSTGVVVLQGTHEFIFDFILRMSTPHQVVARVVVPPGVVARTISALGENLNNYVNRFGPIHMPAAQPEEGAETSTASPQSAEDLYEELKMPEEILSGCYANAVMIGHSATEFSFDFITTFFPRSAVACRVFLAAPNVPRFFESMKHAYQQFEANQDKNDDQSME